ncbi:hypothetical protein [Aliarcobacter butzleri]|uniref:hypothetical protein n=1 Tax=Aliarcobacter butzleri TaxID=28197 RepID=UPI0021B4177A|nr:hypothetical protein [Aliarcobacter butzleri]MCT7649158.1 hypothetical protein [Aliarcobacter butzleri]
MSNNEKYTIKELSFDEMLNDLSNTSPLMMCKKLIEYELYDQQDSIEVLNSIYEEFESRDNVIDNLVSPMLLSVADGLVKHPKLNGTFRKTNITPTILVNEVNTFTYEQHSAKDIDNDIFLTQAEKTHYGQYQRKNHYDTKSRDVTEKEKGIIRNETITYENKNGEIKSKTTATIIDEITGEKLDLTRSGAKEKGIRSADMDHINPINYIREKYKNNPYLYREDLEKLIGLPSNESYINSSLNSSKKDMTWEEFNKKNPDTLTEEEKKKALELSEKATKAQNLEASKLMAKNIGLKGLGDIIILILKPIWFEIKDMFKNGILHGFDTNDKIEAFLLRLRRVMKFINDNILNTLGDTLKDVLGNFIPMLISSIAEILSGIYKKLIQIISDGFMAIKEAFKIMIKPDSEISQAQKADAITKIIASAVIPILIFSFEETVLTSLKFLDKTPLSFLKDIAMIILSGLATTLVVWLLDEIDLFSVKGEKRLARVKEIFELRIETIKQNTDIFEKTSIEVLAKQKLQFKNIIGNMNIALESNQDINSSIYELANFMQIDLKVKSTDEFLNLLSNSKNLIIGEDNFQRDIKLSQLRQLLINYSLLKSKLL